MSEDITIIKELNEINKSVEELTMCFVDGYGGTTIHQTLEEIKVINNDIFKALERIADALEKQVANSTMINAQIMGKINEVN